MAFPAQNEEATQFKCGALRAPTSSSKTAANVPDYLLEGKASNSTALLMVNEERTYRDVILGANVIADHLVNSGAQKGDRALLIADNGYFWVVAYLGILRAGMVCVPLAPATTAQEIAYIAESTAPRCAFLSEKLSPKTREQLPVTPYLDERLIRSLLANHTAKDSSELATLGTACPGFPKVFPDDLAALMFTSGSTGRPRGVMVSHGNIMANTDSIIEYLRLTERDKVMTVLPFHYCFGTSLLHTHLKVGATLVIDQRFLFPQTILERMRDTECTGFAGVPSHYQILLRRSSLKNMHFPHLRYVQQAGGHLAPAFVRELREALPGLDIFLMYGQTEATARLSYLPPVLLSSKPGSIGKGIPGVKLQVLNDSGQPVNPGETGEIVAAGPNIAKGYWHATEESSAKFREGMLYTGDLATVDEEGFIYVVARSADFLKCGGKRVSCSQIEESLLEFGGVVEAAVVGVADEILGEAPVAFVVLQKDIRSKVGFELDLLEFCRRRLPLPLVPKKIIHLDVLPKNSSGKIMKSALKAKASQLDEAQSAAVEAPCQKEA